jgi:hypothetical protein
VTLASAYELQDGRFEFTHLAPSLAEVDYLVPVPTSDDAFEAGAAVATRAELRRAIVRHERTRLRQLVADESMTSETGVSVHHAVVPLLVAAGRG